jgi:PAS domain S-box-containing protein
MKNGILLPNAFAAENSADILGSLPGLTWLTDQALRITCCQGNLSPDAPFDAGALCGLTVPECFGASVSTNCVVTAHRRALVGEQASFEMTLSGQTFRGQVGPLRKDDAIVGCVMLALAAPAPVMPWDEIADDMIELALFLDFSGCICGAHGTSGRLHRHQVLNRPVFDFVPQDSHEPLRQAMLSVQETGRTTTLEMRFTRRYGESSWQTMRIGPVRQAGQTTGLVLFAADISAQKRAIEKLQAEENLLRDLLELQDRERRMVAYEIHDGFIQDIVGARMVLQGLQPTLNSAAPGHRRSFESTLMLLGRAINEGRRLISELRPMIIDEMGIVDALEYLIAEEEARGEMQIRFTHRIHRERLPALLQANVFRIVREALNNARRHGSATSADIRLTQIGNTMLILEIQDNGSGFDPEQVPADRYGLVSIRERAQLFGGGATIESDGHSGTRITVKLATDHPSSVRDGGAKEPERSDGGTHPDWSWGS